MKILVVYLVIGIGNAMAVEYVSVDEIFPGQSRFTQQNVDTKRDKLSKTHQQYDTQKSSISQKGAIPVVKTFFGYVLIDGHHDFLAARSLGDSTVPVKVKADYSNLKILELFTKLHDEKYVYFYDRFGRKLPTPEGKWYGWNTLEDDPNRLFASLSAWKCDPEKGCEKDPNASEKVESPLWQKDVSPEGKLKFAFIEFMIATLLYQAEIVYSYEMGLNPNSPEIKALIAQALPVLRKAQQEGKLPEDLVIGSHEN